MSSQYSSVSIVTRLGSTHLRTDGLILSGGNETFSSLSSQDSFLTHKPLFQGVMKLVSSAQGADCSPPSRVIVNSEWRYTSAAVSFCDLDMDSFTYAHFLNITSRVQSFLLLTQLYRTILQKDAY